MLLSWKHKFKSIKTPDKPFQLFATQDKCGDPQDMVVFLIKLHVSW